MEMNDNTILRIKVPAHLYESVKAQLTLNEANLTLQNYARKLYSLFKKSGATPLVVTGKNFASPDVKNSNVSIGVSGDKLHVGIKGSKDIGKKYADLVAKEFTDLQLQGQITQSGWGGQNDATYTDLTLVPKTTGKKGGTTVTETEDTIKEAKLNFGTKDMKPVKGQKAAGASSDKPKAPKKANAPEKATGAMYDKETSKLGAGVSETKKTPKDGHKKLGLEELKAIVELLNGQIAQLEEKKEEKAPVEEAVDATLKEYEVIYVVRNGKCYRKDDEGNMDEVSMSKCSNMEESVIKESRYMEDREAVNIVRDALKAGKEVKVSGEAVTKIVPMVGAMVTASGKVHKLPQIEDLSVVTVDGESLVDLVYQKLDAIAAKPKPEPKPVDPAAVAKANQDWADRYGPGGGYETGFGRYTGD